MCWSIGYYAKDKTKELILKRCLSILRKEKKKITLSVLVRNLLKKTKRFSKLLSCVYADLYIHRLYIII